MHEARPKAHRMPPPDLAIRQRHYARVLHRAHNLPSLVATKSESLPITSRAGNDRNASPGELDFMHGWTTNRHEGCVRRIPTESELSIATPVSHFKGIVRRNRGARRQAPLHRVFSSGAEVRLRAGSQPTGLTQSSVDSCRECGKPSERTHLLASRDMRFIERAMQHLDRLVIGFPIHRVRRAILTAMGERKARRILSTGADAVDQLGCQCERA